LNGLIDTAKEVAKAGLRQHYRRMHLRGARNSLQGLVARYGPFPDTVRHQCDLYATEVLGHKRFAPWLYVYAYVAGGFKEGWIPDNYYDECVLPHTSGAYGEVSTLRALNSRLFDAEEFPDVAAAVNGVIVDRQGLPIPEAQLIDALFAEGDRVVFKRDGSQSGVGIVMLDRAGLDLGKVRALGSGVFQSFIRQHPVFSRLSNSRSVATIRLTTASDDNGDVRLRAAYLRLGRADDGHVRSASEVRIAIDRETGALSAMGYMPDWMRVDRHPDANEPFAGQSIPNFKECVRVVLRCHERLRFVRCVGWDLCVDEAEKVKLIEWNGGHNGIKFSEAVEGPCFADLNWQRFRPRA
jgi:Sugar-transfer associated ATP-grasp